MKILLKLSLLTSLLLVSENAFSQPEFLPNDPKRPVDKISHDLNIESRQFVQCFENVHPAEPGTRPTSERVHSNKMVLLSCLQKANPDITNNKLDEVMDRYRPGGHEAQEPIDHL